VIAAVMLLAVLFPAVAKRREETFEKAEDDCGKI
jgi:hypothetical protein